jgi:hypothetical protein
VAAFSAQVPRFASRTTSTQSINRRCCARTITLGAGTREALGEPVDAGSMARDEVTRGRQPRESCARREAP